jgi:hypothetical protein
VGKRDLFASLANAQAPPLIDDGSNSVFCEKDAVIAPIASEMGQKQTSSRPFKSRDVSAPCVRFLPFSLIQRVSNRPGFTALSEGSVSR